MKMVERWVKDKPKFKVVAEKEKKKDVPKK